MNEYIKVIRGNSEITPNITQWTNFIYQIKLDKILT